MENNISADVYSMTLNVEEFVPFDPRWITKKNRGKSTGREFVAMAGQGRTVTETPENTEVKV